LQRTKTLSTNAFNDAFISVESVTATKSKVTAKVSINATNYCISLSNGNILYRGDSQGGLTDEIMKFQIRKTVEEHLKKELRLNVKGIKVLSLFFIDRVANYRQYDETGNQGYGKFAFAKVGTIRMFFKFVP
jgi:type III restriction enzyme